MTTTKEKTMPQLTQQLATFIASKKPDDLPPRVIERSKKILTDTSGVMLAGLGSDLCAPLWAYAESARSADGVVVPGTARRYGGEMAAFVCGTLAAALDFDDVVAIMPGHPSAIILGAAICEMQRSRVTGLDLVAAHAVGIEVGGRLGQGITKGHYDRGFHGTGSLGVFSGVATVASLRRLDEGTTCAALGIAASMSSSIRRNFGTMTKPVHSGWAARSAIAAVNMAEAGFSAASDALEGSAGFFEAYGTPESDPSSVAGTLAAPWIIEEPGVGLRKFACYNALQRGMFAVLEVRRQLGLDGSSLRGLTCRMPPGGMQSAVFPEPLTGLQGKFSLEYVLAAGVLDGGYSLGTFSDEAVARPGIKALLGRIRAWEDEACADPDPLAEGGELPGGKGVVEVEAEDVSGKRAVHRITIHPGHPSRELSWGDLREKFLDCTAYGGISREGAERLFAFLRQLELSDDMGSFWRDVR
ncbi:MmgE/PrpD family protein [Pigmentiphaga kullae]|uniref:2-methylcitrate dehydratase PrpD n=1 Tax=Pigmentiphaga kullae TaxID=151784 RepID=A0A4Q7NN69_9BURK|nr:MmgE/PrpD family protein [Pigmentiphaga kullae]RZS86674.1 2-methylcitrate dehydratase PrpD [Pigmentiphaga kullae]